MIRKKSVSIILVLIMLSIIFPAGNKTFSVEQAPVHNRNERSSVFGRRDTYDFYISQFKNSKHPETEIKIDISNYTTDMNIQTFDEYRARKGFSILTGEDGYIEWTFNVEQEGLYNIEILYCPVEGRGSAIERELHINGEIPFFTARHLTFSRVWIDEGPIIQDSRGNDLRPKQIESPMWRKVYFTDYMGYHTEPYYFYFKKGQNTLRLNSVKEPMIIGGLTLKQSEKLLPYVDVKAYYQEQGYNKANNQLVIIQGETAKYKSDPTLYAHNDRTSPLTQPYHPSKIRLNSIAGHRWSLPGQWITWEIEVPESGLYQIALKARQSMRRGLFSTRKLSINGIVPFKESGNIRVKYNDDWQMHVIANETGEPYLFYFEAGKHKLTLETSLGNMADLLRIAENSVYELNRVYRRILMITGSRPDINRDYQLDILLPDDIRMLGEQAKILGELCRFLIDETGHRGDYVAVIDRLARQLADMSERPHTIPRRFQQFKDNIGSLAAWIFATREQPLEIDYIVLASPEMALPRARTNILERLAHEIRSFFASFSEDYNTVGDIQTDREAVTLWMGSFPGMPGGVGRDQAQVLKRLIDDYFVPKTGIPVNIKLISLSALLPATLAGKGPDVTIFIDDGTPVNFAMRNAVVDLTRFNDFKEVAERFHPSAITPLKYNGGVYALPEQRSFNMLFYRTDIFEELGLEVPQTWDDIEILIPELLKYNMEFGLFAGLTAMGTPMASSLGTYSMFLFQQGGELYNEKGTKTLLGSELAINTFRKYTEYYSLYKLPLTFDFQNRFRIGEMPAAIVDFQSFNLLSIFAPEIRGLYDFVPVPGTKRQDGTIDRTTVLSGTNCMILSSAKNYEDAWEFIKWWTDTPTQISFALEMESLVGSAARYPTANMEALSRIPWPVHNISNLMKQYEYVRGIPQVPGGYFLPRHFDFAFRGVVYQNDDPRERIRDAVRDINEEIRIKREELGLDTN